MSGDYRKPQFGSLLQPGHRFAGKSLRIAYLYNGGSGQQTVRNFCNPANQNLTVGATSFTFPSSIHGRSVDRASTVSVSALTTGNPIVTGATFSIAVGLYLRSVPNTYANIISAGTSAGLWIKGNVTPKLDWASPTDNLSSITITKNIWHDIAVVCRNGNMNYFIDGVQDSTAPTGMSSVSLTTSMSDAASLVFDGQFAYMYIYIGRALTLADARELIGDPYVMFRRNRIGLPFPAGLGCPAAYYLTNQHSKGLAIA